MSKKPLDVASDRFVEIKRLNFIEFSKVFIQHDLVTTDEEDGSLDTFWRNRHLYWHSFFFI